MGTEQMIQSMLPELSQQLTAASYMNLGICMTASILFGLLLVLLYGLNFNDNEPQDGSLARSLVLLVPALTAMFWMIQTSVSLSIGLFGTMSVIRFRTPVKRPEDMAFLVIALAVSVACATKMFIVASILVGGVFFYTVTRKKVGGMGTKQFAILTINTKDATSKDIQEGLEQLKLKAKFVSSRSYDGISSFVFNVNRMEENAHEAVSKLLASYDDSAQVNIFYPNDRLAA